MLLEIGAITIICHIILGGGKHVYLGGKHTLVFPPDKTLCAPSKSLCIYNMGNICVHVPTCVVCSDHHLIHTRQAGVDVEEALRAMSLLRERLEQGQGDMLASVSTVCIHYVYIYMYIYIVDPG